MGGEMVSLGGLEEDLIRLAKERQWHHSGETEPSFAISVKEKGSDKPQLILFTTLPIEKESINTALRESGHGRLVRVTAVRQLPQIPLLGSGKINYRLLEELS
jgi:long-chain-fatty-acid--[acyl-carrier-protein] ligase